MSIGKRWPGRRFRALLTARESPADISRKAEVVSKDDPTTLDLATCIAYAESRCMVLVPTAEYDALCAACAEAAVAVTDLDVELQLLVGDA